MNLIVLFVRKTSAKLQNKKGNLIRLPLVKIMLSIVISYQYFLMTT